MNKIKVLYCAPSLEQGGAERQLSELIENLDRGRFEPYLALCNSRDEMGYDLGVSDRFSLHAPDGPTPLSLLRLTWLVRRLKPHIVHTHMDMLNIHGRLAVACTRTGQSVSSVLCTRLPERYIKNERRTRRLAHATMVNSIGIRDELVARAGYRPEQIDVVENGVDTQRFKPLSDEERAAMRERFQLRSTVLLLPGRIAEQKNQLSLIRAVASLRQRGRLPTGFSVVFAGRQERSSRYGASLTQAISELGLGDVFRFLGVVSDVERLLGAVDGVILPSHYEGLPNAVLESMACAAPTIVTPAANTDGLIEDGTSGIQSQGPEPEALEVALERYLAVPQEKLRAMGDRAREQAVTRFAILRMVERTAAVYERLVRNVRLA